MNVVVSTFEVTNRDPSSSPHGHDDGVDIVLRIAATREIQLNQRNVRRDATMVLKSASLLAVVFGVLPMESVVLVVVEAEVVGVLMLMMVPVVEVVEVVMVVHVEMAGVESVCNSCTVGAPIKLYARERSGSDIAITDVAA